MTPPELRRGTLQVSQSCRETGNKLRQKDNNSEGCVVSIQQIGCGEWESHVLRVMLALKATTMRSAWPA